MLRIKDLAVHFPTRFGDIVAIADVDMTIAPGEIHGLVGESGAGKSTVGAAVIGLLPVPGYVAAGQMSLGETDLRSLDFEAAHHVRGARISMIFQDPQTSLNPLMTIEDQLIETIQAHEDIATDAARDRAVALLEEIGIRNAARRIKAYPHQFSGGMRQRVVIALALSTNPELIIADEPTTALDVAVQSQVLALIRRLAETRKIGILLITHDIGVIAQVADRVSVMRRGRVVEAGATADVLGAPQHAYTQSLIAAVPPLETRTERLLVPDFDEADAPETRPKGARAADAQAWLLDGQADAPAGLAVRDLVMQFRGERASIWAKPPAFTALDAVSFAIRPGTVMGLVGESGSGKSTLAKVITGLITPTSGQMEFDGAALPGGRARGRGHPSRRLIQMVFQDPYSSLNSRHRVGRILSEPLWHYGLIPDDTARQDMAAAMLDLVGLPARAIDKYPHQFSGGQRQRIAVARALLARPQFLICDEPTSALDVSIQAQILNLLKDLQAAFGLTILFISHNLSVIRQMADDMIVLRQGRIEEQGPADRIFAAPEAAYTRSLLELTPTLPRDWARTGVSE